MRRLALALCLALLACASSRVSLSGEIKYGKSAEEDFTAGEEEMKEHNYAEAQRFFEHVKNKYPFSKYAPLADLKIADAKFEQDHFVEAADAYQTFVKLHPTHESVEYAEFRAALSYYRDAPGDFILFPPAYEKDQAELKKAVVRLEDFVKTRPQSKYAPEAEKVLADAKARLAEHEWYVADFYGKRGHWAGAAGRLEGLVRDYPGAPFEARALLSLAQAYLHMNEKFRAQQKLQELIVKHPKDPRRAEAEKLLASIRG